MISNHDLPSWSAFFNHDLNQKIAFRVTCRPIHMVRLLRTKIEHRANGCLCSSHCICFEQGTKADFVGNLNLSDSTTWREIQSNYHVTKEQFRELVYCKQLLLLTDGCSLLSLWVVVPRLALWFWQLTDAVTGNTNIFVSHFGATFR